LVDSYLKPEVALKRLRERVRRVRKPPLFSMPVVFSLGSGGGRILSGIDVPKTCWRVSVNSSQRDLDLIVEKVDLTVPCGDGSGSQMNPSRGREDVQEVLDILVEVVNTSCEVFDFDMPDLIPVIASFGHGFGSGSLEPVLSSLRKEFPRTVLMPFVVTPFRAEGSGVIRRAMKCLESVCRKFTCFPASNEVVARNLRVDLRKLPITTVFNSVNRDITKTLSLFFDCLTAREKIVQSLDRSDLFKIVDGELGTISLGRFRRAEDITVSKLKVVEKGEWLRTTTVKEKKPVKVRKQKRGVKRVRRKKLKATYIVDGAGKFTVKQLSDVNMYLRRERNVDIRWLKPIIIERAKPCDFLLLKSGFRLKCARNIIGVY